MLPQPQFLSETLHNWDENRKILDGNHCRISAEELPIGPPKASKTGKMTVPEKSGDPAYTPSSPSDTSSLSGCAEFGPRHRPKCGGRRGARRGR